MPTERRRVALAALALGAAVPAVLASPLGSVVAPQARAQAGAFPLHAGTLEVPLNKSEIVSADTSIAKAMIGNDEIADVLPVTNRSLYVLGKKMGTTSLTLFDSAGRVITVMDVAVGPDVEGLSEQIRRYIPGETIDARIANDSIVLSGTVNDPGASGRAALIATTYAGQDKVVNLISVGSSQQVMLEVRFAEVNRSTGTDVGVSSFGISDNGTFDSVTGAGAQLVPDANGFGVMKMLAITDTFGIFRKQFSIGNLNISGILNAMEQKGFAKTLAQPTLLALSGERASFLAGGEFPVPVAQSGTGTNNSTAITVEFKPFGVSLGFTPTVLGDRTINLLVEPEVSSIDPTASLTVGNITIPGLRTRRASTTLELRDGESFAIAGLLQKDFKTSVNQLPLLGSLPIIGSLFKSSSFQKGETELLIVVTPHLVAPIKPGQVRLPTDAVTDPSAAATIFMPQPAMAKELPPAAPPASDPASAPAPADAMIKDKETGYAY